MVAKISRDLIESHLNCRYKASLKRRGDSGTKVDFETLMSEIQDEVRQAFVAKTILDRPDDFIPNGVEVSVPTLMRGSSYLFNAMLIDDHAELLVDGLQRKAGASKLGDFHYLPMLFDAHEKTGPTQRVVLEVFGQILEGIQGRTPRWDFIIHGKPCKIQKIQLRSKPVEAQRTLVELKANYASNDLPQLMPNGHCEICEFRLHCSSEAISKDDLSLLRTMSETEIKKYARRGIFTVMQLSCTFRARKEYNSEQTTSRARQHALQALAIREKKIYVVGNPVMPTQPTAIYLDVEGVPRHTKKIP
jgi:predicted RecB family nuclease